MIAVENPFPDEDSLETVKILLKAGSKINAKSSIGYTALMYAADSSEDEAVQFLIENGADVNIRNNDGDTALLICVRDLHYSNDFEIAKALVKAGADVSVKDKKGNTALDYVLDYNDEEYKELRKILQDAMNKK